MVSTPKPAKDKPWDKYRGEANWKLLEPGWAGALGDDELVYILDKLRSDDGLSYWWGFRPKAKRRSIEAVKAVAVCGDPDNRTHNVRLVRGASGRAQDVDESDDSKVTKIAQSHTGLIHHLSGIPKGDHVKLSMIRSLHQWLSKGRAARSLPRS